MALLEHALAHQAPAADCAAGSAPRSSLPLGLHGWLLYDGIFVAPELRFGFAQALSVMTWLAVLAYWIESLFYHLDGMEPLVLLAAAATVHAARASFPASSRAARTPRRLEFRLHLALAMARLRPVR